MTWLYVDRLGKMHRGLILKRGLENGYLVSLGEGLSRRDIEEAHILGGEHGEAYLIAEVPVGIGMHEHISARGGIYEGVEVLDLYIALPG